MKRILLLYGLLVLVSFAAPLPTVAQDGISRKQQEKNLARKSKEDAKARKVKEKEDRKQHLSIQDKEARKRIKRNLRSAERGGIGAHRRGFPGRLFTRRR